MLQPLDKTEAKLSLNLSVWQIQTGLDLVILRHQKAWAQFYLLTSHGRTHMIDGFKASQRWVWRSTMAPYLALDHQTF